MENTVISRPPRSAPCSNLAGSDWLWHASLRDGTYRC